MIEVLNLVNNCSSPALGAILSTFKRIIQLIEIIVPIILIIWGTSGILSLMKNPDEKNGIKKVVNKFIAAMVVFIVPVLINFTMGLLDDTFTVSACWNSIYNNTGSSSYVDPYGNKRKKIINEQDYEKGKERPSSEGNTGETIEGSAQQIGDVVWDPTNLNRISNLTSTQLIGILNAYGGNAKNFIPYAQGLITAEHKYNVNVFFLIGVEALESGWITSSISRNCNNLGGVCASSAHPSNGCGRNSNCSFAYFSSVNEFVDYHASMLHTNYLTPGGTYYHGPTPSGVVVSYCPGCSSWPSSVTSIANGLFKKVSSVL